MDGMFVECSSFNQPLNSWNVSGVTSMDGMFFGSSNFNQDLSGWNVSNVRNMTSMFYGCSSFNQPLNSWNVSNVTSTNSMFYGCSNFNQPLNLWNISNVTDANNMLSNTGLSLSNYNATLNGWAFNGHAPNNLTIGVDGLIYGPDGSGAHNLLTTTYNWVFEGDQYNGPPICYNKGTMILCEDGYRPIENLKPGTLVETYKHGLVPLKMTGKGKIINNPSNPFECMYCLPDTEFGDLIVTGGHGVLKPTLTKAEVNADKWWFIKNKRYSRIENMYLQRVAFNPEFIKLNDNSEYTIYHIVLEGPSYKRYGVWANGILSESTFEFDLIKNLNEIKEK